MPVNCAHWMHESPTDKAEERIFVELSQWVEENDPSQSVWCFCLLWRTLSRSGWLEGEAVRGGLWPLSEEHQIHIARIGIQDWTALVAASRIADLDGGLAVYF